MLSVETVNNFNSDDVILYTEGLTKKYKETIANNAVTVAVPRGKIVGFVGENGSGKTTFIRMICKLIQPTAGTFSFNTPDGKCRIGAIVETPSFIPYMSARDNLHFQAKLCGADESLVDEVLKTIGLTETNKKVVKSFSLGMRQRLGIGMALLSNPELLILDEPTNGLDPQGIIEMREFLKKLSTEKDITLLISSHILSELSLLAEHYLFIHYGQIIKSVPAEELFSKSSKQLRFKCSANPEAFIMKVREEKWADGAGMEDDIVIIYGPHNYSCILSAMADLDVSEINTKDTSLEGWYMNLIGGAQS